MANNPFLSLLGRGQSYDPNVMLQQLAGNDFANQLLSHYGLSMPTSIGPNLLLPNTGFFGSHPRLSGGIENALIAASNIPTGRTTGENIANVARGLLSVQPTRDQMVMSKLMAPFAMAKQLQDMETGQENMNLMRAHENYYNRYANGLMQDQSLPWHSIHVGNDGNMYGVSKKTGQLEAIPRGALPQGLFMAPGSGMGWSEELSKGRHGLLDAQKSMTPDQLAASKKNYEAMWQDQITLAGGKASATNEAHYNTPGVLTPADQMKAADALKRKNMSYMDYVLANPVGDTSQAGYERFVQDATSEYNSYVSPQPATPLPRGKKGKASPAAPPQQGSSAFDRVAQAMEESKRAKEIANNPKHFMAPTAPPARIPGFYDTDTAPSFLDILRGGRK